MVWIKPIGWQAAGGKEGWNGMEDCVQKNITASSPRDKYRNLEINQLFLNKPALFPYFNNSGGFLMFLNCDLEVIVAKAGKLLPR